MTNKEDLSFSTRILQELGGGIRRRLRGATDALGFTNFGPQETSVDDTIKGAQFKHSDVETVLKKIKKDFPKMSDDIKESAIRFRTIQGATPEETRQKRLEFIGQQMDYVRETYSGQQFDKARGTYLRVLGWLENEANNSKKIDKSELPKRKKSESGDGVRGGGGRGGGDREPPRSPDAGGDQQGRGGRQERRPPREIDLEMPWRSVDSIPKVILSDYKWYRENVTLPERAVSDVVVSEGGAVPIKNVDYFTGNQAVLFALESLSSEILKEHSVGNISKEKIERCVERLRKLGDNRADDLNTLVQVVFKIQHVYYDVWATRVAAKGVKSEGISNMCAEFSDTENRAIWFLFQDPLFEKKLHAIRGRTISDDFVRGGQNDFGRIEGGVVGAVEKLANEVAILTWLRMLDKQADVTDIGYTAMVLLHPYEYFNKGGAGQGYDNFRQVLMGIGEYVFSQDGQRAIIFPHDTKAFPSAFHDKSMARFVCDNFDPDKVGWLNIGRMLALLDGPSYRDSRTAMFGGRKNLLGGVYELHDFIFASNDQQVEMAQAAYSVWLQLSNEEKLRIVRINLSKTYYDGRLVVETTEQGPKITDFNGERKAVFNYDEEFVDTKGRRHRFVDIGSFDRRSWGAEGRGHFLNDFYVSVGYAFRYFDKVITPLCSVNPEKYPDAIKAAGDSEVRYKHLTERGKSGERSIDLDYEAQAAVMRLWRWWSEVLVRQSEEARVNGRERLPWAVKVNQQLREGLDKDRYRVEFESCGIYGKDWTLIGRAANMLTASEKVGKIMGKLDRPDVWLVWLKEMGLVDEIKMMFGNVVPAGFVLGDEWKTVGINDFWEYMAYTALVSFAGYSVKSIYVEKDRYGNNVPRVKFDLAFGKDKGERYTQRASGWYWKEKVLQGMADDQKDQYWEKVRGFFVGEREEQRVIRYGKLDEPTFSPLANFYEKMNEEMFIDGLFERYLQETFDKDQGNWIQNEWGKHMKLKKRWNTWALLRRQMRYTVGELGLADDGVGRYVHDQINIDENGRIIVNEKGLPTISLFHEGFDRVASMTLGSVGVWRPQEDMMTSPVSSDPEKLEMERIYRSHTGLGDAGEAQQLSWMPLYYNKYMMMNFFTARLFDVDYRYEQAINAGEEWEEKMCYRDVADLTQQEEFFLYLEKIAEEDHVWVEQQRERYGLDSYAVEQFKKEKVRLMMRDIKGDTQDKASEDEMINLQKRVFSLVGGIFGKIPVVRSSEEGKSWAIPTVASGAVLTTIAVAGGAFATVGGTLWLFPIVVGAGWFGTNFFDKGVDKDGRERASGPIAGIMAGARFRTPVGTFAVGMLGKRIMAREAKNIATGWKPCWDSAIPFQDLAKALKQYKDNLKPFDEK